MEKTVIDMGIGATAASASMLDLGTGIAQFLLAVAGIALVVVRLMIAWREWSHKKSS
jgi:hypothetical protein